MPEYIAGAIALTEDPISSSNSTRIDVRHHFLRDPMGKNKIMACYKTLKNRKAARIYRAEGFLCRVMCIKGIGTSC